ncbi:Asp23/Gls24 family envelope stress response protein [Zhaonella formicivorans]|uniref:Asp23/Gls24 family envelope stress response protein n=1 Tax=Zhaonella formicivorans TaxID=2528593 RepID=UPI0010F080B5|nr:Asp23/Gls24 family envelope stress response protein [Zhaonella formicivorans]
MANTLETQYGKVSISKEVIATLAGYAAAECYGLVGMASQKLQDGLFELLGREATGKGIQVNIVDNRVSIDVYIVVGYGTKINEVAHNVMEKVHYTVQRLTGIPIEKVNIIVQGVKVID